VREELEAGVYENRVLRKIMGNKTDAVRETEGKSKMMNLMICAPHKI
jgi:hypothetical protein